MGNADFSVRLIRHIAINALWPIVITDKPCVYYLSFIRRSIEVFKVFRIVGIFGLTLRLVYLGSIVVYNHSNVDCGINTS